MNKYSDYPFLQSNMEVFYVFIGQYQFEDDEVIGLWIQCNHCKKPVPFQLLETVRIYDITAFIKAVAFNNVGISWMIQTREKSVLLLMNIFLVGEQEGRGIIEKIVIT